MSESTHTPQLIQSTIMAGLRSSYVHLVRLVGMLIGKINGAHKVSPTALAMILQPERQGRLDALDANRQESKIQFCRHEQVITNHCDELLRQSEKHLSRRKKSVLALSEKCNDPSFFASLDLFCSKAEREAHQLAADTSQSLSLDLQRLQDAEQDAINFRKNAGLERAPRTPALRGFYALALIVFFVLLCLTLNSWYGATINSDTLLHHAMYAGAFTLLPAFFAAYFVRRINCSKLHQVLFGYTCWILALVVIPAMAIVAVETSLESPAAWIAGLTAESIASGIPELDWYRIALLCICGFTAAIIGYSMDDKHPGYGKVGRELTLSRDLFGKQCAKARNSITNLFDRLAQDMGRELSQKENQIKRYERAVTDFNDASQTAIAHRDAVANTGNYLLHKYRSAKLNTLGLSANTDSYSHYEPQSIENRFDWQQQARDQNRLIAEGRLNLRNKVNSTQAKLDSLCFSCLDKLDLGKKLC